MSLNQKQKYALSCMKTGKNVFLTGSGGVGKTYLIKIFSTWAREEKYPLSDNPVAVTSTTGTSALLINGTTLHSFAGIGLGKESVDELFTKISKNFFVKRRWLRTKILIIDEISMLTPELFEKIEELARRIKRSPRVFGGIQVILSGDFAQLPPPKLKKFCFESEIWDKVIDESIYLKDIIRQDNPIFQKCLNEIRLGECSQESLDLLQSRVGIKLENDLNIIPTMLYSVNCKVDVINRKFLKELIDSGKENYMYEMRVHVSGNPPKTLQFLVDKLVRDCPADQKIILAEGVQVMIITNMPDKKLANGSRGVIVGFREKIPLVQFLDGRVLLIEEHCWTDNLTEKNEVSIKQLPLALAYSTTIHKSQGLSLDYVKTSIDSSIFEYGQAYTDLSRCKNPEGLTLDKFDPKVIKCHPKVKDFYKNLENKQTKTITDFFFSPSLSQSNSQSNSQSSSPSQQSEI